MQRSLTEEVWQWHVAHEAGVYFMDAAEPLWALLRDQLGPNPTLFRQGWPEEATARTRPKPAMMHVLHAVCMLEPTVASLLLRRLSALPGFDVEQRTENGVTPLVAAAYNRSRYRVVLLQTLLDLGANPNSPADMVEKPSSRTRRQRKSALAHLLSPTTAIFGNKAAFPLRQFIDTDSVQALVERGAHFGAAYAGRKGIRVVEYRQSDNGRYRDGHCLPAQCYRTYGNGHAFDDLAAFAEAPRSPSVRWLEVLLSRHATRTTVRVGLAGRPAAEPADTTGRPRFRWQLPSPFQDTMLGVRSNNPRLPVYGPIKAEVWALLYCLHRTSVVPETLHPLLLSYFVGSHPYVGFYDATRLERRWNRQRSRFIDTGYVVPTGPAGDPWLLARLTEELRTTMTTICYGHHPQVTVPVDAGIYEDVAHVAAGLYGKTPTIPARAYKRVISRQFTRVGGHEQSYPAVVGTPEELQRALIYGYVSSDPRPNPGRFVRWLCTEILRSAVRRVYEAIKAGAAVDPAAAVPLTAAQVRSISDQF